MAQTRGQDALPCGCSLTLLFLQLLACGVPANGRADFAVLAPSEPILAVLGKDAELPCHLSLNISAEDMELRWYRDQPSPAVHVHRAGRDVLDEQMARYQGRTTFLGARLAQGWAAVRIHNVTLADNGSFHCCFRDGAAFEEATLWLRVAGVLHSDSMLVHTANDHHTPVSEKAPSMAAVLPLALVVMGLASAGITCLFWKCRRKKNRNWLDEGEGLGGADKQGRQASRNGDPTFQGWGEDDVIDVSPSLDPNSASPRLALSKNRKKVRRLFFAQELPEKPGWFDQDPCVLGQERFLAGRYYWEVQVGLRKAWSLGVCLESLDRKGRVPKAPQHGIWALELYKKEFWALTFPRVLLHPPEPLHRVGILLDCDAGTVSFYSVGDRALIYMFSGLPSSVPLRPFFCLWTHDRQPLTICSEQQPPEVQGQALRQGQHSPCPSLAQFFGSCVQSPRS
ncbi:butyrophilin subfamily 1 member A1-like isoform X1 [Manis javanica]|uniref:butyrophilin subfamily 1 member A1-like isoform X1 n=1 Tax=Manis javanica TaxID=9974 RepID=UPI00187906A4|nr:erythroid membrane-associated protein-like [Manis javanica]